MKKIIALVLALAMVLAVATAFAGNLTVKNSETGTTYNFYRILDLTGRDTDTTDDDTNYDAVVYKLNSKWSAFFSGTAAGAKYIVDSNNAAGTLGTINVDGVIKYINITEDNRVTFTNEAMEYALTNNISFDYQKAGNTGEDVLVENVPLGYYLMVPLNVTDEKDSPLHTSGSVASLTSTIPDANIYVKATKPNIEKHDNVVSADIGKEVTYTVTGTVPNTSGIETYVYKIYDKMSTGLTFKKDVVVTVDTAPAAITSACTIEYNNADYANGFIATIPVKDLQTYVGKTITLTYHAVVNDQAVVNSIEKNAVQLEYGNKPGNTEKTTVIEEELYSAKVIINKYTGDDKDAAGAKLADAKFVLMKIDNGAAKYYKYTAATETTDAQVTWVDVAGAPTSGTANVTDAMAAALKTAADADTITKKVTDNNGAADFKGLADGTYYLVEYEAPNGYNRIPTPVAVTVEGTDADTAEGKVENQADNTGNFDTKPTDASVTADVQNQTGTVLPSTGGIGTTIFYILGGLLVVGAAVILVARRKAQD